MLDENRLRSIPRDVPARRSAIGNKSRTTGEAAVEFFLLAK